MTDLELLHHYTTATYLTLVESSTMREFYRKTVVQVGLSCDHIMRAILAVSSLHLAHHRPHRRDHYQAVAIAHHQAASQAAMPLILDATPESAQMLFLFSVLTTFYALGWPRNSDDDSPSLKSNSGFPDWVYLFRGTKGFIDLAGVPNDGPLAPLFTHSINRFMLREGPEASESSAHASLTDLEEVFAQRPLEDGLRRVYVSALGELKKSFGQAQRCAAQYEMTDAFTWIFLVAEDLLPLLRTPKQEAVAIFAFFCVLLKKLDGHWWMHGWGEHLIAHAYELLDEEGRLWIRWAVEEIGWVPPSAAERL